MYVCKAIWKYFHRQQFSFSTMKIIFFSRLTKICLSRPGSAALFHCDIYRWIENSQMFTCVHKKLFSAVFIKKKKSSIVSSMPWKRIISLSSLFRYGTRWVVYILLCESFSVLPSRLKTKNNFLMVWKALFQILIKSRYVRNISG